MFSTAGPRSRSNACRAEWITDLDTDHENLRAAIAFCMSDPQEAAAGAELACDLWRYWETHGFIHLCAGEVEPAAGWFGERARTCENSGNTWYHAYARWGLGVAALLLADHGAAARLVRTALDSMRKLEDPRGVVLCLDALSWIAVAPDQAPRALTLLTAADAAWRQSRLPHSPASASTTTRRSPQPGTPCRRVPSRRQPRMEPR